MKLLIVIASALAVTQAVPFSELFTAQWTAFKLTHRKEYQTEAEEIFRKKIFVENSRKVAKHNELFEQGLITFKAKLNEWADLLHHEFVETLNGYNRTSRPLKSDKTKDVGATFVPPANIQLPQSVDWRAYGAVTPVKNQGRCGSCWSFSATGALEGQNFRKTNVLTSLSEQNLVDCSISYGNAGCGGGWPDTAFTYVRYNQGIDTEQSYPYEGINNQCRYNPANSGAIDRGYVDIQSGNEEQLRAALATVGPISIAIDASQRSFQFYYDGVYYDPQCSPYQLDHAVLAVGYGTDESGQDYWLVKNSWGTTWGNGGYIKIARNRNNHCGVATQASYPLV